MGTNTRYSKSRDTRRRVVRLNPSCRNFHDTRAMGTSGALLRQCSTSDHNHCHVYMPPNAEKPFDIRVVRKRGGVLLGAFGKGNAAFCSLQD